MNIYSQNHFYRITKISGLDTLENLEALDLTDNRISKIEGLENLVNLKNLYLHRNNFTIIEGLQNLQNLRHITIGFKRVSGGVELNSNIISTAERKKMGVKFDPEYGMRIDAKKIVLYCQLPRETDIFDIPTSSRSNSQKDWKKKIK